MPESANGPGRTVVVIGAGPVGLAAAAHLVERGLEPVVLEAGEHVASAVAEWSHIRLFSPWRYNIDSAARRLLEQTDWQAPDLDALPSGGELIESYLLPLASTAALSGRIRTGRKVIGVTRDGLDKVRSSDRENRPFLVRTTDASGGVSDIRADAVIDASGVWGQRNPMGAAGLPAAGESAAASFLSGPLPDVLGKERARFAGKHTLVVGMGHSAANTLLALAELAESEPGTSITWAIRGARADRLYGGGDADGLPARGALGSRLKSLVDFGVITLVPQFSITGLEPGSGCCGGAGTVTVNAVTADGPRSVKADTVIAATGFRPDLEMLREVRLHLDTAVEAPAALGPLIDPNDHSCGTVPPHGERELAHPDPGFYIAGVKSYGRAPTFLLATGYEQVRSIAAALAGDREAADAVELDLPETGVCSTDLPDSSDAGCCGPPAAPQGFASGSLHGYSGEQPTAAAPASSCCAAPDTASN
ncbi:FAD-dependent oxidoreductase [Streptomyces anulatus]|uniref:FAD-dependent oxidoreductase n=1 Tax=Streptomyces anulatus TaxID=1892 RepID=UPI00369BC54C